jgi:hypothetical protein
LWRNQAKQLTSGFSGLDDFNAFNAVTCVNGMPFPAGVTGMVAQTKPNNQPEETE